MEIEGLEYLSQYEQDILLGTDKETIHQSYMNHQFVQISSIKAFRKYLDLVSDGLNIDELKLYQLTSCLLLQQCSAISSINDIMSLQIIFKERYTIFLEDFDKDLSLRKTILKSISTEANINIYNAIQSSKSLLLTNINNAIVHLDNVYIKKIFSDDSYLDIEMQQAYENFIIKLKKEQKDKLVTKSTYKRMEKEILLYLKSIVFQKS